MKTLVKTREAIEESFYSGEIDNSEIVELLQLCDELLQLKTVPNYANIHDLSPHGVYKCRKEKIVEIAGKKFVIDND